MLGFDNQVWVTSVISDEDVQKALLLCYSLRRSFTSRKVAVIASKKISMSFMEALYFVFDFVFHLEEALNVTRLNAEDYSKLYSLLTLRSFENCAYLSPSMVAVKNCDDIFSKETKEIVLLEDDDHASVFLFKPSYDIFKSVTKCLADFSINGTGLGVYLKKWLKNEFQHLDFLSGKYNTVIKPGKVLIGSEQDISIVNLTDYLTGSEKKVEGLESIGLLGKLIGIYVEKILEEDVRPLLGSCASGVKPSLPLASSVPAYNKEPIAIVGMSCRYPGSNNLEEFWDLLFNGQDGTCNPPPFRWLREQCTIHKPDARKTNAGFLKVPVDEFDAKFFGVSPKEVVFMDPQHRLLHEVIWEGLEDACIDPHTLRGSNGAVFLGSWLNNYNEIVHNSTISEFYRVYMGNSIGAATARISFLLGMTGPSIATESGCSSAMVALHLACRSLQLGETSMALAGGVNLLLHQFDKDIMPMVVSPDGHCKTFSEDADGFARAEGCGVLVLKRLSDALKDGDHVWALIRGSAVSQEGVSKSMGTPTIYCESLAMQDALRDGEVRPEDVSYVEAHGTGTVVGDPMEVAAIAKAYYSPLRKEPLVIGSVKTNFGHTEACSGITGIMKVVLAMVNKRIPAHLNFSKLNPSIDLNAVPAVIPLESIEWKQTDKKPRIAGVSSFGITGTDAHVIVEESPQISGPKTLSFNSEMERPLHLLKISAKTEEALDLLLEAYQGYMEVSQEKLSDIAFSINDGRANFNNRVAIIAQSTQDVVASIQQRKFLKGEAESIGKVCFLFTGQGSQYPGMAKQLYESSPIFQMHFDYCDSILSSKYNLSLKSLLWSGNDSQDEISRTINSQTSIFCVEYALLKLWESWVVKPDYALGHSLGEFAAAVCAGIISVEDAITLVAERSKLIDDLPRGKMLVIQADYNEVQNKMKRFAGNDASKLLDYAAINSSEQTVVAGDSDVVMEFFKYLTGLKLKCIVLAATHAFHSKHMDPMLDSYRNVAKTIRKVNVEGKCEFISGMKGTLVPSTEVNAEYWVQHTREKVNFLNASKKAVELGCGIFIEVGPQPVLSALTMMNNESSLLCLPSLKRKADDWDTILTTLGKLYLKGVEIDWSGLDQFYTRRKVRLPHYPFIGKKFWPDLIQVAGNIIHPLVGSVIPNASSTKLFQCGVNLRSHEYIKDHAIGQTVVFPGAGYLEMSLAAGLATVEGSVDSLGKPSRPMKVENLMIKAPLALQESSTVQLQTVVELNVSDDNQNDWNDVTVKIFHRQESDSSSKWLQHATATFSPIPTAEEQQEAVFDKDDFIETLGKPSDPETISQVYQKLASIGLKFGPSFRSIENVWKNEDQGTLLAKVKIPQESDGQSGQHIIHPVVFDAMIQAIMMKKLTNKTKVKLFVPIKIGKLLWLTNGTEESNERYIHVFDKTGSDNGNDESSVSNAMSLLLDLNGTVLAVMSEVEFIDTTVKAVEAVLEQQTSTMPDLWEESWRPKVGPSQYRHDLSICLKEKVCDDTFKNDLDKTFNKLRPETEELVDNLEKLVYLNYIRCFRQCGWTPVLNETFTVEEFQTMLSIKPEYTKMLKHILGILEEESILKNVEPSTYQVVNLPPSLPEIQELLSSPSLNNELAHRFQSTLLLQKVGENYSEILQGKQSALPILFVEEGSKASWPSVAQYYRDHGKHFGLTEMISSLVENIIKCCKSHLAGERDVLRILEIGAGTGSSSKTFIETMENLGFEYEYTFTDISPAFFIAAEKLLEPYLKRITFKKLNIEDDPVGQGFIPNYFDWIIAGDVIHATKNLKETFGNVRMLLRDNGSFDMVEQIKVSRLITYMFGLLEGFWRFEDLELRSDHCIITNEEWTQTLENCGFKIKDSFPCMNNGHAYIRSYKCPEYHTDLVLESQLSSRQHVGWWMLFHFDDSSISNYLLKKIPTVMNRQVVVVRRGERFKNVKGKGLWQFELNQESEDDFHLLMKCVEACENSVIEGIVWCWSLDKASVAQETILKPYFSMIKSVLQMKQSKSPKITTIVNGVIPVEEHDMGHFHPSTIWGFSKAGRNERTELSCRCVDIGGEENGEQVFYELWNLDKETQVAYHENTRYIPKVQNVKPSLSDLKLPSGSDRFQLILPETKAIADLQFGTLDPIILEEMEVEIQVKASALNFRDVFSVLKPSDAFKDMNSVGFDFAGVVKRVGSKVTKWSIGDSVFGVNIKNSALPSHIKADENDVFRVPEGMTLPDACTLPAVYATSYYCLIEVANISPKDTVLIHTASGGVGLSAIQICNSVGAKIIATAGSKRKQNYLRSLGIEHVFHSRNTNYGDEILELTNGRGVDVVLNSLTSEGFKEATLKACAKGARFVEMSKLSIWQPEEVKNLRPDVEYTIADLSAMDQFQWRKLMSAINDLSERNVIQPIPYVRFDGVHIREALQYMQKAKHIGKVVCTMPEVRQEGGSSVVYTPMFNASATYLITGGLGGIGFVVCQWMVEKGARHVLLAGRNPPTDLMQQAISKLNTEHNSQVQAVQLDVGNFTECKELIQVKIPEIGLPSLRGIMHAAGTLKDGLIENQTWETLSSTFNSKVKGTLNLHELTKDMNLEHFVLFSSLAAIFGSPGQCNHSAGNNFEDSFAHYRNSIGLPATTVNWGQWGEVGIATEVELPGIKPFSSLQGVTGLEYVLKSQRVQTGVINIESFVLMAKLFPHISSMLDERVWKSGSGSMSNNGLNIKSDEFWQQYDSLEDKNEKLELVRNMLRFLLRSILKLEETDVIEDNANFQEMGVDSLMFVEIKNALQTLLGDRAVVNASALRDCNTIVLLADTLVKIIEGEDKEEEVPTTEEVNQLIQEDSQLPEHIRAKPGQKKVDVKDISTVLLTGCTGTIGPYVLRELTVVPQITQVICLMRPSKQMSAEDRLKDILKKREVLPQTNMDKIRCVTGNVAQDQLGMESGVWEGLLNKVDAVFHFSAKVNHVEQYRKGNSDQDVRAVNLGGVKNVLEFACSGEKLKHVYCASSMLSVTKLDEDGSFSENWLEINDLNGQTTLSYPISKFVEELLVKQAILERGIPGKLFRYPLASGDSKTGCFLLENNHTMLRYFFILKNGMMPTNPVPIPVLSVDICAWASVKLCFNPDAPDDVFNVCNRCPGLDQEFVYVAKKLGYNVKLVEFSEFTEKIKGVTSDNSAFAMFKEIYRKDEDIMSLYSTHPVIRQWVLEGGSDTSFMVSKKIASLLPEFYNESHSFGDQIYRDMLYAKKQGWFEKHQL